VTAGGVIGWDVGGANVKAAAIAGDGRSVTAAIERPLPLWRDPRVLPVVLAEIAAGLGPARAMAVTMTAELADCFATKREGVGFILDAFIAAFPSVELRVYGVDGCFRTPDEARQTPLVVAAANWRATAALVARTARDALLLDVGSTTTDIIPIVSGAVAAKGCTDPDRLRSGELVYTGVLRTPVCAVARSVPLRGARCRIAAEYFAVAADVHLWLGHITESEYAIDTPDGRGRTRAEAGARIARMVCADLEMLGADDVTAIAAHVWRSQVRQIAAGIRQVTRRLAHAAPRVAILAGQGVFLARAAAEVCGLAACELSGELGSDGARTAPAAAVGYLLAETLEGR
jgi:(4-(4-[2-(gamma-L-glutamylamino)ethyl]phenoxymethyl)furan-2-yl)methanamine synthase